jgi:hypothetical protein
MIIFTMAISINNFKVSLQVITSLLLGLLVSYSIKTIEEREEIIIGYDISEAVFLLSLSLFVLKFNKSKLSLFVLNYIIFIQGFFVFSLKYEYERLFMIILPLIIITIRENIKQGSIVHVLIGVVLLILTFYLGIYSSLSPWAAD